MALSAPLSEPLITGYENNSIVHLTVGTPIALTCRADYGDPPYVLTWTNHLEVTEETTAAIETSTTYTGSSDGISLSSDTGHIVTGANETTPIDIPPKRNGYLMANTTVSVSKNDTLSAHDALSHDTSTSLRINETMSDFETISLNRLRPNSTGWDYRSHRITERSLNETETAYKNVSTASVESVEPTTQIQYNTTAWAGFTDSKYQDRATHPISESTTETTHDYSIASTTVIPTYILKEDTFQPVLSLFESR